MLDGEVAVATGSPWERSGSITYVAPEGVPVTGVRAATGEAVAGAERLERLRVSSEVDKRGGDPFTLDIGEDKGHRSGRVTHIDRLLDSVEIPGFEGEIAPDLPAVKG